VGTLRKLQIASLLGILITCAAIILLSLSIVPPEHRSEHFWPRVSWACFLSLLVWVFLGKFMSVAIPGSSKQELGGVLPAFGIVVVLYSTASLILLMARAWIPENSVLSVVHMPAQIIVAAIAAITFVFLYFAFIGAGHHKHDGK
jgi:hypothetical protein